MLAANLRARKGRAVSDSLASCGQRASDQIDIWSGVAEMSHHFKVTSDTSAMRDVYSHVEDEMTLLLHAFTPIPGQRGFAAFIAGKIVASNISRNHALLPKSLKTAAQLCARCSSFPQTE